jgi:carbon-monoxide dehydrogenase medium subunit
MGFAQFDQLIDLKRLPELRAIDRDHVFLSVGALATHAEIASNETVQEFLPSLAKLCNEIANPRVRASGTVGGNLCFAEPRADPPTLLAALDAQLVLLSTNEERLVSAREFITGALDTLRRPDELLLRIEIPYNARAVRYERIVFGHRTVAGAAAALGATVEPARIWVGGVAMRPAPLPETEALLASDPDVLNDGAVREAVARDIAALDVAGDEDASADYRRHLAETVARRAIAGCREGVS